MERTVDREPIKFAAFVLIVYVALYACQISQFALLDMNQKLHIIPNNMVLLFMFLEPIFFTIQNIPLNSTNKTNRVLIFLQTFFFLSDLGKFIDNDSSNNLIHDDFDDEKIAKIYQDVQ